MTSLEDPILTEQTNASSLYELTDRGVAYLAENPSPDDAAEWKA